MTNLIAPEDWFVYYVASPYSHQNVEIKKERHRMAVQFAKTLTRLGYSAFVPIAYDGLWDLDPNFQVDHSWSFWEKIDLPLLDRCSALILLELLGWDRSQGVSAELEHCYKMGIPVMCMSPYDAENDEAIKRKMSLLTGMINRSKRLTPHFNPCLVDESPIKIARNQNDF